MADYDLGDSGEFDIMKYDSEEEDLKKKNNKNENKNIDQYILSKEEIMPYSPDMLDLLIDPKDSKQSVSN